MAFLVLLAIVVALSVISYLLMPKPKAPKPGSVEDLDNPTAEAGREIPVVFGTITTKGLNVLDFGDKSVFSYKISS